MGKFEEAFEINNEAIRRNPQKSWNYKVGGEILEKMNRQKEALKYYEMAISIDPELMDAYNNKVILFFFVFINILD